MRDGELTKYGAQTPHLGANAPRTSPPLMVYESRTIVGSNVSHLLAGKLDLLRS